MAHTIQEISKHMFELFAGKQHAYAIKIKKQDGGKLFIPARDNAGNDLPYNVEVLEKHLKGEISAGIYVLDGTKVQCVAVDFDGKKGDALKDALHVKQLLLRHIGLTSWLERSQSGNGIHLWIFFDNPVPASLVRKVLSSKIPEFFVSEEKRKTSYDRMFPNQENDGGGYGNLCAIPLNGTSLIKDNKTVFINDDGSTIEGQSNTLIKVFENRNAAEVLLEAAEKAPPLPTRKPLVNKKSKLLTGGMKLLSPYGCNFLKHHYENGHELSEDRWFHAMGQFAQLENGELIAQKFSSPYKTYDPNVVKKKFDHEVKKNMPVLCSTIQEDAEDAKLCKSCPAAEFGCRFPYEMAKIPLADLEGKQTGRIYCGADLSKVALEIADEIAKGKRIGFPWGYDVLDDATELRPKNLIVVAARRSVGKTAVMIDASVRGAEVGIPQYIFSLEMSYEELALRYLARLARVDHTLITTGRMSDDEWLRIKEAASKLDNLPIFVDDTTRNTEAMLDKAGELVYQHGQGPMWIDYLQLVQLQRGEKHKEAVDRSIFSYKNIAKILDIPVIPLAQFNRGEETYEGEDDLDSWLKDTGNIEQHADVIHYIRGKLSPGRVPRRWRIHKERSRPSGLNFKFEFEQKYFEFTPSGLWTAAAEEDGVGPMELSAGFDGI